MVAALLNRDIISDNRVAILLAYLTFTPLLVFVSWLLTIYVDEPFKNFAYELDIMSRKSTEPEQGGIR